MAQPILAATPLSHNDISGLAQLFEQGFHYHRKCQKQLKNTDWRSFLHNIRTLIGLSYTATLVDGELLEIFDSHLCVFLQYQSFLSKHSEHAKLAKAIADIVCLGSDFFRCLGHPRYYEDFLRSLRDCVTHITEEIGITPPLKAQGVIALIAA